MHHSYYVREEIYGECSHLFSRLSETNVNIIFWGTTSRITGFLSLGVLGFKYGPRDGRSFSSVRLGKCHRKVKGKVIPLQARCGPECGSRYSSTSSMTTTLEGGEWSAARLGRTLPPGKTRYPFHRRLGGPQGRSGRA